MNRRKQNGKSGVGLILGTWRIAINRGGGGADELQRDPFAQKFIYPINN